MVWFANSAILVLTVVQFNGQLVQSGYASSKSHQIEKIAHRIKPRPLFADLLLRFEAKRVPCRIAKSSWHASLDLREM